MGKAPFYLILGQCEGRKSAQIRTLGILRGFENSILSENWAWPQNVVILILSLGVQVHTIITERRQSTGSEVLCRGCGYFLHLTHHFLSPLEC